MSPNGKLSKSWVNTDGILGFLSVKITRNIIQWIFFNPVPKHRYLSPFKYIIDYVEAINDVGYILRDWKHFPPSLIEDLKRDVSPIREGWLSKYSDFRRDRTFIGNLLKMEILNDRNKMMRPFLWFLSQLNFFWDLMKNGWKDNSKWLPLRVLTVGCLIRARHTQHWQFSEIEIWLGNKM